MADHLLELANEILQENHPIAFAELWELVSVRAGLDSNSKKTKVSRFFTNLSFDGRFFNLGGNVWDLKSCHKLEEFRRDADEEDDDDLVDDDDLDDTTFKKQPSKEDKDDSDEESSEEDKD